MSSRTSRSNPFAGDPYRPAATALPDRRGPGCPHSDHGSPAACSQCSGVVVQTIQLVTLPDVLDESAWKILRDDMKRREQELAKARKKAAKGGRAKAKKARATKPAPSISAKKAKAANNRWSAVPRPSPASLSQREAAAHGTVTFNAICGAIRSGALPSIRVGGRVWLRAEDVDTWVATRRKRTDSVSRKTTFGSAAGVLPEENSGGRSYIVSESPAAEPLFAFDPAVSTMVPEENSGPPATASAHETAETVESLSKVLA